MFKKPVLAALIAAMMGMAGGFVFAGTGNTVTGEISITGKDGAPKSYRANVVVFLESAANASYAVPAEEIVISQRGRRFRPSVLPVLRGQSLAFPNDDKVLHNVFSLSKTKPFDLGNYNKGESRSVILDTPGLVNVYCNIHPQMVLDVLVLNNPWFAKTEKEGTFSITGVPDGDYTLRVWNELSEEQSIPLSLAGGEVQSHQIQLVETKVRPKHNNKYGKGYRGKY